MDIDSINKLIKAAETLTELPRTGYVLAGVHDVEKVSSHSFNVSFLVILLGDQFEKLNKERALKMALVHDIPESLITDLPQESKGFIKKDNAESKAASELFKNNPELLELFLEYKNGKTLESLVVHDLDKLQMQVRAKIYERTHNGDMSRFLSNPYKFRFQATQKAFDAFCMLDEDSSKK